MMGAKTSAAPERRRSNADDDDVLRRSQRSDIMGSLAWEKIDDDGDHGSEEGRATFDAAA